MMSLTFSSMDFSDMAGDDLVARRSVRQELWQQIICGRGRDTKIRPIFEGLASRRSAVSLALAVLAGGSWRSRGRQNRGGFPRRFSCASQ
jgi:hypothetical protein